MHQKSQEFPIKAQKKDQKSEEVTIREVKNDVAPEEDDIMIEIMQSGEEKLIMVPNFQSYIKKAIPQNLKSTILSVFSPYVKVVYKHIHKDLYGSKQEANILFS